jgi:hypothetical protein
MSPVRSITPADVQWLDGGLDSWHCSVRWSLRGGAPSTRTVSDLLWRSVVRQQSIWIEPDRPVGLIQVHSIDLQHDVGRLAVLLDPDHGDANREGIATFLRETAELLPLRKLYLDAYADHLPVERYFGAAARLVGCYRGHQRRSESQFADLCLYELWCDDGEHSGG